jgi:hypothetical protein
MNVVVGESWSGNSLVYYPSTKKWGVKVDDKLEDSTQKDLDDAIAIVQALGFLIIDIQLEKKENL